MRHSVVELDLDRFTDNVRAIRASLSADVDLIQVIKANAYGHGVEWIAPASVSAGIRTFSVAHAEEAFELRRLCGDEIRVILLGVGADEELRQLSSKSVEVMIPDGLTLRRYEAICRKQQIVLRAHVKVDTGMGRFGVLWQEAPALLDACRQSEAVSLVGLCSHFASADGNEPFSLMQLDRFREVVKNTEGPELFRHMSNTAGFQHISGADFDAIRIGVGLLGYDCGVGPVRADVFPVLSWHTTIAQIRELPKGATVGYGSTFVAPRSIRVAVCNIGYADGFPRGLSDEAYVLIRGKRCPVLGRVSMNWITVDVSNCENLEVADPVCLIGRMGSEVLTADDLARWADTIVYDVLTAIKPSETRVLAG